MDQLKTYLAVVKKYHFWPLVVVIIVAGLYAWKSGKAHYDQLFAQGSSELKGVFDKVQTVANTPQHPNQFFIDEGKKLNAKLRDDVKAAWQRLYDNQKNVLTWEPEFAAIADLKPTAAIPDKLRTIYWDYAKKQVPKLFSKIDIREERRLDNAGAPARAPVDPGQNNDDVPPDAGAASGGRAMSDSGKKEGPVATGTVVWPETERNRIASTYDWGRQPRSKQIRYAQEDLWVYGALLDIITDANAGVKDPGSVAIKKIEALDIAQAVGAPNNALFPLPVGTVIAPEAAAAGTSTKIGRDGPTDEQLENGRYVSADGAPLAAPDPTAQFKLMPIRMRLIMDQRKLPDLLVACANSPLPVEVRQVQLNVKEGESRSAPGGRGMGSGGARAMGQGGGGAAAPAPAAAAPTRQAPFDPLVVQTQYDQRIEIRGFIYIFNPPDLSAMGGEEEVEESTEVAPDTEPQATEADATEPAAEATPAEGEAPAEAAPAEGEAPAPAEGEAAPAGEATPEAPPSEEPAPTEPGTSQPAAEPEPASAGAEGPG